MSKKSCFWRHFEKEHGKGLRTLFKSEPQQLWHIYSLIRRQLSWKKCLLVICKIFRLVVNTFTASHRFPLINRDKFRCNYLKNKKPFLNLFLHFWIVDKILNTFSKNITLMVDLFPEIGIPNTLLGNCLKSRVSEDLSTSNVVNGIKQCWNWNDTTFIIFFDHCEGN